MKFSVVIPTYGRSEFLEQAINSVLNQSYKNFEIIIIDDNGYSTEDQCLTEKMIKKFKNIKYITNEINKGANFSRNRGISESTGDYICLLDDDDEFIFNKLEILKNEIEKYSYDLLYSKVELNDLLTNKNRSLFRKVRNCNIKEKILSGNFIGGNSCVTLKKSFLIQNNILFDQKLLSCQDWECWTKMIFSGAKVKSIEKKLVKVKIHTGIRITNNLVKRIQGHKDFFEITNKYILEFDKEKQKKIKRNQSLIIANIYYDMEKYNEYNKIVKEIKFTQLKMKDILRRILFKLKIRVDRFSITRIK